ncbi:MAG: transposase, partial [Planctomycetes bacterium]|nr:transposase [Planctomycetota bacterium]
SPCLNTEMINVFLKQFSETIPVEEHAVVVWDGAGFHRAKALNVPGNITLISLPPYSPELNPIENRLAERLPGDRPDENRLQCSLRETRSYFLRCV